MWIPENIAYPIIACVLLIGIGLALNWWERHGPSLPGSTSRWRRWRKRMAEERAAETPEQREARIEQTFVGLFRAQGMTRKRVREEVADMKARKAAPEDGEASVQRHRQRPAYGHKFSPED